MTTLFSIILPLAKSAHQRVSGSRTVFEYSNINTDKVLVHSLFSPVTVIILVLGTHPLFLDVSSVCLREWERQCSAQDALEVRTVPGGWGC